MKINTMGVFGDCHNPIDIKLLNSVGILSKMNKSESYGYINIINNITACLYKSGKILIYGIKKIEDVSIIWNKLLSAINDVVDISKADERPTVKFIAASEKLPYTLELAKIVHNQNCENIEYEPELFPGLIWKTELGTYLLFASGNIIVTGPNSEEKLHDMVQWLREKLEHDS